MTATPRAQPWREARSRPAPHGGGTAAATPTGRLAPVQERVEQVQGQVDTAKGRAAAIKARLERYALFRVLESVGVGFSKDQVPSQAAAVTYYGIFSLFPLLLLFMSLAALALQSSEQAQQQILN